MGELEYAEEHHWTILQYHYSKKYNFSINTELFFYSENIQMGESNGDSSRDLYQWGEVNP